MTNAPEYLYNLYVTYDIEPTGTSTALFYTVTGDTLLAGAAQSGGNYIPDVYAEEYGTLNFSLAQKLGEYFKLTFQAKNLTNPKIKTEYRGDTVAKDKTRTSFTRGIDYSISLAAQVRF
jgi:hypothetical protein